VSAEIAALISLLDERLLLQATGLGGLPVAVNGELLAAPRWLADGDVLTAGTLRVRCNFAGGTLRLELEYDDSGYETLPPVEQGGDAPRIGARRSAPAATPSPRRTARLVWLALAGFALVAAWLFTARSVGIRTEPLDAVVSVDGTLPTLSIGGRFLLQPGSYRVDLSAPGHEPITAEIEVGDAPRQEWRYSLQRLPGRLVLQTPAQSLVVRIDGADVQPGADGTYAAAAGARRLEVDAPLYLPHDATVEVIGRGEQQTVVLGLVPNWADVTIESTPPGARIRVAGLDAGATPASVPVAAGTAKLELRLDGYKPWTRAVTVVAGQKLTLPPVELVEADAMLSVRSTPAGAAVTIDQRYQGDTPLDVELRSSVPHTVIVAKPGYAAATRRVEIARRGSEAINVVLEERRGLVRVVAEPADAELWVNGVSRGIANQSLELPALPQKIELRKPGYVTWSREVTPRPGQTQLVEARLLTPAEAVLAAVPATITTRFGATLRLVGPGAFTMGAPRREQGRRPNEAERAVRITRAFYLGVNEVTNREFREFKAAHTSGAEKYQELAGDSHPVVMVSWNEAASFCNWLSDREGLPQAYVVKDGRPTLSSPLNTGYRLPTEAEWEWASRWNGGGGMRRYPWGMQMPPGAESGNFADVAAQGIVPNVLATYNDGWPVTAPVGSFAASPLGFRDLGGNAAEWVSDRYTVYTPTADEVVDPLGPDQGPYHVIRGSSWRHSSVSELRQSFRDFGDQGRLDVGFRLARSVE